MFAVAVLSIALAAVVGAEVSVTVVVKGQSLIAIHPEGESVLEEIFVPGCLSVAGDVVMWRGRGELLVSQYPFTRVQVFWGQCGELTALEGGVVFSEWKPSATALFLFPGAVPLGVYQGKTPPVVFATVQGVAVLNGATVSEFSGRGGLLRRTEAVKDVCPLTIRGYMVKHVNGSLLKYGDGECNKLNFRDFTAGHPSKSSDPRMRVMVIVILAVCFVCGCIFGYFLIWHDDTTDGGNSPTEKDTNEPPFVVEVVGEIAMEGPKDPTAAASKE